MTRVGNLYPREYERMVYEGLRADGETEVVSLSRSAWAGSQKYGALLWSGDIPSDWWALRNQVAIGLSAGMAGIPWWNCDLGGFFGVDAPAPLSAIPVFIREGATCALDGEFPSLV